MIPLRCQAVINKQGKLIFVTDTDILRGWLERYAGKTIDVTFQSHREAKTRPQLGYLWGHVIPQIAEYTGYSEEEVYGLLKYEFLLVRLPKGEHGDYYESVRSLSDCNKEEVAKFIDDCISWATNLGCEIYPSESYGGTM